MRTTSPTKPGWQTSEFWVWLLTALLAMASGVAAAAGWAFDSSKYQGLIPVVAGGIVAIIGHGFVVGRSSVKVAMIKAASNTGGYVVAAPGAGPGDVVDAAPVPLAAAPADPAVAASVPADPSAADVPPPPPSEAVADDDVPPLVGV